MVQWLTLPSQYRVPRFDPGSWLDPISCDLRVCMPQLKADEANIKKKKKEEESKKKKEREAIARLEGLALPTHQLPSV